MSTPDAEVVDTGAGGADASAAGGRGSLADHAYEHLRDALLVLDIRPGEPLKDDAIARDLDIGRTPVREALKRLETDRLVVTYPRRGTFATGIDITDLGQISEVRRELEPLAAAGAARRASAAQRRELTALAALIADLDPASVDATTLMRHDVAVHRGVYRACGNPHLEDVLVRLDNLATRIWCLVLDRLPALGGHVGEHADLLRAVVDGRADDAAALAAEHVAGFERTVRGVL
ncbi:GntR family transcriptional regulator [uncultured Pseudokineococcus sp.]|uniref:GntR family transcriptional regulator n=1 Tax=uncultured Pseudokineococcus sp. TaxID=1642928 RepID=UPI002631300A|nr:GntR family transcriptional regulator [uncultured Pseudokineococcus sp.]